MRKWLLVSLLCLIGIDVAFTQKTITNLDQNFQKYSTVDMDVRSTFIDATRKRGNINLSIPNPYRSESLELELYRSDVISDNYVYHIAGPDGVQTFHGTTTVAMRGSVVGRPGTKANVVVDRDYFFAAIEEEDGIVTYIEPKKFFDGTADQGEMVVYQNIDVKPMSKTCMGALHTQELKKIENRRPTYGQNRAANCFTVDYAVASDSEYYESVGSSSSAARNRVISVTDLVNTDYDDAAFQTYQLSFSLVEHYVSTSDASDEWGNNPADIEQYLNWFTDWGKGTQSSEELSSDYDLASLWTGHNLSGSTIGLAWLGVVCGSQFFPYHFNVLENYRTGSTALDMSNLRALTSHEIGHNFDAGHDSSSGFIMSGSVNSSNPSSTWSSASVTAIEDYVAMRNDCLTSCGGGGGGGTNPPVADFTWNVTDDCAPGEVRYTDNSSNNPTSWQWTFQGGTPSSSTSQNPIIAYNTPGIYDVSLTVSNSGGSDAISRNNIIVIDQGPIADFSYTLSGNTVTFNNNSSNYTSSFWNFGDGSTSSQTNPSHTYSSAGTYTVRLEAGGSCGSDTRTVTITIDGPPNADFSQNITSGCEGVQIYYYDQSTGEPTSWFWEFEGGTPATSTSRNPRITYNEAGIFDVRLTVSNANGSDQFVRTNHVNIEGYPLPFFTYSVDGTTVSFQNQSNNGSNYAWNFGDGSTSFLSNPVHTYNEGGTYTVRLTAYNDCGSDVYSQNVEIVLLPVADFVWEGSTEGCQGHTIQFLDESTNNVTSYAWSFPGGNPATSTAANPQVTYNQSGQFNVSLTVYNSEGSDAITVNNLVSISPDPIASFNVNITGGEANFSNQSQFSTGYFWQFGDGSTSELENPSHLYESNGEYIVRLTSSNDCSEDVAEEVINIVLPPEAVFQIEGDGTGCVGQSFQMFNLSLNDPDTYNWISEGADVETSTAENPIFTYSNPGTYSISLTASNASGSDEFLMENIITILPPPEVDFDWTTSQLGNGMANTVFNTYSNTPVEFSWQVDEPYTLEGAEPNITWPQDIYTVTLIGENICGSEDITKQVSTYDIPEASFEVSTQNSCVSNTIELINTSSGNSETFEWIMPGATPSFSADNNPIISYQEVGSYTITLISSNPEGSDTMILENAVNILPAPEVDFEVEVLDLVANFTATSNTEVSYTWNFGDGSEGQGSSPEHVYNEEAIYIVTLEASNICGSDVVEKEVSTYDIPVAGFEVDALLPCIDGTINFENTTTDNATSWEWYFPGASPSSSVEEHPTVSYSEVGNYAVTLIAHNPEGSDTLVVENAVEILPAPEVDFEVEVLDLVANFTATSNTEVSYAWNFGDGSEGQGSSPEHVYNEEAIYIVTLEASNICGSDVVEKEVSTYDIPVAGFEVDALLPCIDGTINFENTTTDNATSWEWYFPGANPSSSVEEHPTVSYSEVGNYAVTLIAHNPEGSDTLVVENAVEILPAPEVDFEVEVLDLVANFTATSNTEVSYTWNFGDGSEGQGSSPEHVYNEEAIYIVTLEASNICGSDVVEKEVSTYDIPVAGFEVDALLPCIDGAISFENTTTDNATSWEWYFPGASPSTSEEEHPTVSYSEVGNYTVTLIAHNPKGSDTLVVENAVEILPAPEVDFEVEVLDLVANFTATSNTEVSYAWNFGDGSEGQGSNPEHAYNEEAIYTVALEGSNICGSAVVEKEVSTYDIPVAGFEAVAPVPCINDSISFENTTTENATSWEWYFPGASPSSSQEEHPTVSYSEVGNYTVTLIAHNPKGSDTLGVENAVEILPAPEVDFAVEVLDLVANFTATINTEVSYAWNFGDGSEGQGSSPEHVYSEETIYSVTMVGQNVCGSDTVVKSVSTFDIPIASFEVNAEEICVGVEVQYFNTSTDNTTSYEWILPGADTTSSTVSDPLVRYNSPGWYDATLIASNPKGSDTIVVENAIHVVGLPESYFEVQQSPSEVVFINLTDGFGTFHWLVDEESVSTDTQLVYTFEAEDIYQVSLLTSNACGVDTFTSDINTYTLPEAGISIEIAEHCLPGTVALASTSSDNSENFEWILSGSEEEVSELENPTATYLSRGNYDVTLIVTNPAGSDTLTLEKALTINDAPEGSFTYLKNVYEVSFVAEVSDGYEYYWNFGDGNQGEGEEVTHVYGQEGEYTVQLTIINACGTQEITENIIINDLPTAFFESENKEVCFGKDIAFTNLSSDNSTSYKWIFDGGFPAESSEESPIINYAEPGKYDVTLIAYNNSGSDTLVLENYISVRREPELKYEKVINGNEVSITNLSNDYTSSYWLVEEEKIESEVLRYTFSANGVYDIQLTVSNECGIAQEAMSVEVSAYPEASVPFEPTTLCVGEEWLLEDVTASEEDQLLWNFIGANEISVEGQGASISFEEAGYYHLEYIIKNEFGEDTVNVDSLIYVVHPPDASIDFNVEGPAIILRYDNQEDFEINWDVGDGNSYDEDTLTHLYTETGTYDIVLEVFNGCGMSIATESVDIIVDEDEEPVWEINLMTFPNPTQNYLNISIPLLQGALKYEVVNVRGKLMMSGEITENYKDNYSLDVSDLMPGHYEVIFYDDQYSVSRKIVKIKM